MRRFVDVFADAEIICAPSTSCVGMIRDHYPKMAAASGDAGLIAAVSAIVPRVFEFSELLVDKLGVDGCRRRRFRTASRITRPAMRSAH